MEHKLHVRKVILARAKLLPLTEEEVAKKVSGRWRSTVQMLLIPNLSYFLLYAQLILVASRIYIWSRYFCMQHGSFVCSTRRMGVIRSME
jgi:hypothetical protein